MSNPRDGNTYLFRFKSGIMCTGSYRNGTMGEPQEDVTGFRCDCCGRFCTPVSYIEVDDDMWKYTTEDTV